MVSPKDSRTSKRGIVFRVLRRFCELAVPQLEACEPSVVDGSSAWEPSEQRASDC